MNDVEFISADELLQRLARWDGPAEVAQRFIRDLAHGHRAIGNGYTAWPGYKGFHWTTDKAEVVDSSQP